MYRYALEELFKWKEKPNRKPMIIHGARHVGKTWLVNYPRPKGHGLVTAQSY